MKITDEEIDAIAVERDWLTRNSRYRTVYESSAQYSRVGICGEIALREFFGYMDKPKSNPGGGDGGVDLRVSLRDKLDKIRIMTVGVKCAVNPTWLWIEPPKKRQDYCEVYVLAQYNLKTKRAKLIKWHWGDAVCTAPITFEGKRHHSIAAGHCLDLNDLRARYPVNVHLCACGDWGCHGRNGQWYCDDHKPMFLF